MRAGFFLTLLMAVALTVAAENVADAAGVGRPSVVTVADLFAGSERSAEAWSDFDAARYRDMSFYKKDGVTRVQGLVIDYDPETSQKTFSIDVTDDVKGSKKVHVGTVNPDGTFALDVAVPYPQFDYLRYGNTIFDVFMVPGDTLSVVTSAKKKKSRLRYDKPDFYGFNGPVNDGVAVTLLADSLRKHYATGDLWRTYMVAQDDSMKVKTYANNEQLGTMLDGIVADLPTRLAPLSVSAFAKDILSICIIGDVCEMMEDLDMHFRDAKGPKVVPDSVEGLRFVPGERLDPDTLLAPRRRHLDLMYDNPLMLCRNCILPNRWKYSTLFHPTGMAAVGMIPAGDVAYVGVDDITALVSDDLSRLYGLGTGNCFVAQLVRAAELNEEMSTCENPSSDGLVKNGQLIANVLRFNDYVPLADALMSAYTGLVQDVMIAEDRPTSADAGGAIMIDSTADGEVLERIIVPYRGNVLFLDFWGIGCGPCRAGMLGQKPILAEYADRPFRALYIANVDDGIEACKKWLRKEEIGGEHIFVSNDDWMRLRSLFNFSGIPFGVIIDTDGTILKTGIHLPGERQILDEVMRGK